MQLSIIIPVYNEQATIAGTLMAVGHYLSTHIPDSEIIVVDDGSIDTTHPQICGYGVGVPVRVLTHQANMGKGAAVRTGIQSARGEFVLFMDADLATDITDYDLLDVAIQHGADIAIGSRYLSGSTILYSQPWFRIVLSRVANTIIRLSLVKGINDTQCGFKLFHRECAMQLASLQKMNRWSFDIELLALARRLGYVISEVPITWQDSTVRKSRFRAVKDTHRMLFDMAYIAYNLAWGRYGDLDQLKKKG